MCVRDTALLDAGSIERFRSNDEGFETEVLRVVANCATIVKHAPDYCTASLVSYVDVHTLWASPGAPRQAASGSFVADYGRKGNVTTYASSFYLEASTSRNQTLVQSTAQQHGCGRKHTFLRPRPGASVKTVAFLHL